VKNIPTHLSEGNLKTHFDTVAPVTDVKIAFKGTRHRKFCFVGYKTEEAAKKAVEHFNNTFIGLNRVTVS
jgi:multiple RNA-binding domain-containing protein 1